MKVGDKVTAKVDNPGGVFNVPAGEKGVVTSFEGEAILVDFPNFKAAYFSKLNVDRYLELDTFFSLHTPITLFKEGDVVICTDITTDFSSKDSRSSNGDACWREGLVVGQQYVVRVCTGENALSLVGKGYYHTVHAFKLFVDEEKKEGVVFKEGDLVVCVDNTTDFSTNFGNAHLRKNFPRDKKFLVEDVLYKEIRFNGSSMYFPSAAFKKVIIKEEKESIFPDPDVDRQEIKLIIKNKKDVLGDIKDIVSVGTILISKNKSIKF